MQGKSAILEGGQELSIVQQKDFDNGNLLDRIITAVNNLASHLGATAVGKFTPPPPVDSIQVQGVQNVSTNTITCSNELLHWVITHNQPVSKNIRYFTEVDTSPNFTQPHVVDHGTSRTGFLTLPTYLNDGVTKQTYYMRSYAQYPGSDPVKPTVFGGLAGATQIQMSGTTGTTLLSSTGSGTASSTGTQGGRGLGVDVVRPAPGPKRNLSQ
jgi:hypothetical protein